MPAPAPILVPTLLCLLGGMAAQTSRPSSRPSSRPDSGSSAVPAPRAQGSAEALALAAKVRAFAGGAAAWEQVQSLTMRFGDRRVLHWDRRARKVRIESLGEPRPRTRGRFIKVMVRDLAKREDLLQVPASRPPQPKVSGYAYFINDFYWLLVTLKVLDPGVQLSIEAPQEGDPKGLQRLRLRFAKGTGITARNTYLLHVEAKTGRVLRWDYQRSARSKPRSWQFADYQAVGPLNLSLTRKRIGGKGDILLRDVQVNQKMPADIWTRTDRYLAARIRPRIEAGEKGADKGKDKDQRRP